MVTDHHFSEVGIVNVICADQRLVLPSDPGIKLRCLVLKLLRQQLQALKPRE